MIPGLFVGNIICGHGITDNGAGVPVMWQCFTVTGTDRVSFGTNGVNITAAGTYPFSANYSFNASILV